MARPIRDKNGEAERFKLLRKALELTQSEMGEVMGRDQGMISGYERGRYAVHPDDLRLLNSKYGVSYEWFYSGSGKMFIGAKNTRTTLISDLATLNNSNEELHIRLQRAEKAIAELQEKYDALLQKVGN